MLVRIVVIALLVLLPPAPPPPPAETAALHIAIPDRPRDPVWVELTARGVVILDAIAPPGNGYCVYAQDDAWCEVTGPATVTLRLTARADDCAAGVLLRIDKRPAGWRPLAMCRAYLPAVL